MRSFHLMAFAAATAALGTACGDGGNGPSNGAPTAAFAETCTLLSCTFDNTSTDPNNDALTYAWTFGDGGTSTEAEPTHDYAAAGTYTVKLTVTDDNNASDDFEKAITVGSTPGNQLPVAAFTPSCSSLDCTFTSTSSDPDGTIASYSWDFGDGSPASTETSPSHTYGATELTTYTVTLTVTDNAGGTDTESHDISVSPPATLTCGSTPDCSLAIETPATVTVTLVSSDCELAGNTFKVQIIPPGGGTPVEETLFTDGCDQTENPPGTTFELESGAVLAAGTEIKAQVISGGTTLELPPAIRVSGSFATGWTLEFDDGAQSEPPEPDFNDLVISIVATP